MFYIGINLHNILEKNCSYHEAVAFWHYGIFQFIEIAYRKINDNQLVTQKYVCENLFS